jgi:hypothetical protein
MPPPKPEYVYMIAYGGKLIAYPVANPRNEEHEISTNKLVGGMCLSVDDWHDQEHYELEVEAFLRGK